MRTRARVLAAGAGLTVAASTGAVVFTELANAADSNTLSACVDDNKGTMRLVADGAACDKGEHLVTWSITGPQGIPGPTGSPGAQGPKGDPGTSGGAPAESVVGFLKVDGILGDATTKGHENEIEISSFSWGVTQTGTTTGGGGGGTGKANISDIHVTKHVDRATALLLKATLTGQHIQHAKLTLCDPSNCTATTSAVYDVESILITSDQQSAPGDHEAVSLNFAKFTFTAGGTNVGWDAAANKTL